MQIPLLTTSSRLKPTAAEFWPCAFRVTMRLCTCGCIFDSGWWHLPFALPVHDSQSSHVFNAQHAGCTLMVVCMFKTTAATAEVPCAFRPSVRTLWLHVHHILTINNNQRIVNIHTHSSWGHSLKKNTISSLSITISVFSIFTPTAAEVIPWKKIPYPHYQ